jgi:hypothetical protein
MNNQNQFNNFDVELIFIGSNNDQNCNDFMDWFISYYIVSVNFVLFDSSSNHLITDHLHSSHFHSIPFHITQSLQCNFTALNSIQLNETDFT